MRNLKKVTAAVLAAALLLAVCAMFGACQQQDGNNVTPTGEAVGYSVTVETVGGMPMAGVAVSVYIEDDLQNYAETDLNGKVQMSLPQSDLYTVSLSGVPKGYALEERYPLSDTNTKIVLESSVIQNEKVGDNTFGVGDVMCDFTVTTPDGTAVTLSEMLQEKEMVLINFWYTGCSWCVTEFPYMEEAYQMYQDKVGIVAVDPLGETNEAIAAFTGNQGLNLTFPLAACPASWANSFGISGYPVSVIVDRYGVIVMIESGAITSLRPFTCLFDTMTGDDYEQKLYSSIGDVLTVPEPTYEMASSEEIAALLGTTELEIVFHPEEDEETAKYTWPFIETEKNGEKCLKASNQGIDESYAILYADVTLKKGQALGFDFLRSTEMNGDVMYVIVDREDINSISGYFEEEQWESCYPLVAQEDGVYEVALCYLKDSSTAVGDDTVYIKNMRIVDIEDIDSPTYLPRMAATANEDGFTYTYEKIVYNQKDGYYHVGTANGPLLLADLMNYTQFSEESTVWEMTYNGEIVLDGVDYSQQLTQYCNYASNSQLNGICTVNQELYELLQVVDQIKGFDEEDDQEWLKLCKYFAAYGTDNTQLEDPIAGLAPFSAYTAKLGKNVATNYFYYNRIIIPRGLVAEFVPSRSGVYRITSRTPSGSDVEGWIFDENRQELLVYQWDERMFDKPNEVSMVYYMEAGTPYYIDIAFWDPYEEGYIYYDVEFLGSSYSHFRSCAPGPFTYDTNATGDDMYHIIVKGIDVVLGSDGYYYHDLGNGKTGSKIYVDFVGTNSTIHDPIVSIDGKKGLIDSGAFDFSKTENDDFVLTALDINENDQEKTLQYLKGYWGDDFEVNYEEYLVEDVFAGIYHGHGEDKTEVVRKYLNRMEKYGASEGCVAVTEELAEALQLLMGKFTFNNVDEAWRIMCYYYDYMG